MRKEFERFMKSRRVWSKWVRNFKTNRNDTTYKDWLDSHDKHYFIFASFTWIDTEEGYEFWDELQEDWQNHLQQLKSKGGQNA